MTPKKRSGISVAIGVMKVYWLRFCLSDFGFWLRRTARGAFVFTLITLGFVFGILMPVAGVALVLLALTIMDGKS